MGQSEHPSSPEYLVNHVLNLDSEMKHLVTTEYGMEEIVCSGIQENFEETGNVVPKPSGFMGVVIVGICGKKGGNQGNPRSEKSRVDYEGDLPAKSRKNQQTL